MTQPNEAILFSERALHRPGMWRCVLGVEEPRSIVIALRFDDGHYLPSKLELHERHASTLARAIDMARAHQWGRVGNIDALVLRVGKHAEDGSCLYFGDDSNLVAKLSGDEIEELARACAWMMEPPHTRDFQWINEMTS
jgi:hypothetical protein